MKLLSFLVGISAIFWSCPLQAQEQSNTWQMQNLKTGEYLILDLVIKKNHFKGSTRKKTLPQLLGLGKYRLGVLFKKIPKHLVAIDGVVNRKGDTTYLKGTYTSFWSKQEFEGYILRDSIVGYLVKEKDDGQKITTSLKGDRKVDSGPARDYVEIVQKAIKTTEEKVFLADVKTNLQWQEFKKNTLKLIPKIRDDYEFWLYFNYGVRSLPFSHYGVQFNTMPRVLQAGRSTKERHVKYSQIEREIGLLTVHDFSGDGKEMRASIEEIKEHDPENLIIDFRNNGGGSIESAMPLAQFITKDTVYGGVFLTQKWFKNNDDLPAVEDYKDLKHFSAASYSLIIEGIHEEEGLCLRIDPGEVSYGGNIYVLINNQTASTCEPFVYSLKHSEVAIIIGETTAGAMLNGEAFLIDSDINLFLPTADFYTVDGFRIDQNGVKADVEVPSEEALDYVLDLIAKGGN